MPDKRDIRYPVNRYIFNRNVFSQMIGDQVDGVPQLRKGMQPVQNAERGPAGRKKRLRGYHQYFHGGIVLFD